MIIGLLQLALFIHVLVRSHAYGWLMAMSACRLLAYVDPLLSLSATILLLIAYAVKVVWPNEVGASPALSLPRAWSASARRERDIAHYRNQLSLTGSVDSRLKLAQAYCESERFQEALTLLESAASGIYVDDPVLLGLLAWAQLGLNQPQAALATIQRLESVDKPQEHTLLVKARALEAVQCDDDAARIYESLLGRYSGLEPKARLAVLHQRRGRLPEARQLALEVTEDYKRAPWHVKAEQRRWLDLTDAVRKQP